MSDFKWRIWGIGKSGFLYEDYIGRPILMSEYEDYDTDGNTYGDGSSQYFKWE